MKLMTDLYGPRLRMICSPSANIARYAAVWPAVFDHIDFKLLCRNRKLGAIQPFDIQRAQ